MAVTYGFYNSLNKDRVYNAEQMSAIFDGVITDGVFASIGGKLMPTAGSGMQVIVKPGKCWFNSTWTVNDAELPLAISSADVSLPRIDAIVVEVNSAVNTRMNSIKVVTGIPSANPVKPTLISNATQHQYALGYVTVPANSTSISGGNIENNVGKSACPFVTSILQQTNIDDLFNQWEIQFQTWFQNVQSQLSGNVASNLQAQIDAIVQDGYGKNGVVPTITISSGIQQLYSGLDALLTNMTARDDKRFYISVSTGDAWQYGGGSWIGHLRKYASESSPAWDSATLYSYSKEKPVLFLTRNGSTNTWEVTEIAKGSDLGGAFRVGDIRYGLPKLGPPSGDWHECDGEYFDASVYPDLATLCADSLVEFRPTSNDWARIAQSLRPSYVAEINWQYKAYHVRALKKVFCYTFSKNAADYGSNRVLKPEIDKCIIYDIINETYEVHPWTDTSNNSFPLASDTSTDYFLYYKTGSSPGFYAGIYTSFDYDDDDGTRSGYLRWYESQNGYDFTYHSVSLDSLANQFLSNRNKEPNAYVIPHCGKINVVIAYWVSDTNGYQGKVSLFKVDSMSAINGLKLSDAYYTTDTMSGQTIRLDDVITLFCSTSNSLKEQLLINIGKKSTYNNAEHLGFILVKDDYTVVRLGSPVGNATYKYYSFQIDQPESTENFIFHASVVDTQLSNYKYCYQTLSRWRSGSSSINSVLVGESEGSYISGNYWFRIDGSSQTALYVFPKSNFAAAALDSKTGVLPDNRFFPSGAYVYTDKQGRLAILMRNGIYKATGKNGLYAKLFPKITLDGCKAFVRAKIS